MPFVILQPRRGALPQSVTYFLEHPPALSKRERLELVANEGRPAIAHDGRLARAHLRTQRRAARRERRTAHGRAKRAERFLHARGWRLGANWSVLRFLAGDMERVAVGCDLSTSYDLSVTVTEER
jgi:hypothetical protein